MVVGGGTIVGGKVVKRDYRGNILAVYQSAADAGAHEGVSKATMQNWCNGKWRPRDRRPHTFAWMQDEVTHNFGAPPPLGGYTQTLCWSCARACGGPNGCSWSRKLVPVEGWTATRRDVMARHSAKSTSTGKKCCRTERLESYLVHDCPEFVADREDG